MHLVCGLLQCSGHTGCNLHDSRHYRQIPHHIICCGSYQSVLQQWVCMRENLTLGYSTLIDSSLLIISEASHYAVKKKKKKGHLGDTSLSRLKKTNPVQH